MSDDLLKLWARCYLLSIAGFAMGMLIAAIQDWLYL